MASSSRLSLVSPLRIWLVFNALFIALVASSWHSSYRLAAADNERLVVSQVMTLTRSRFEDIQSRRFRDFVESIGHDFGDLFVQVKIREKTFQFGDLPERRHCGSLTCDLPGHGTTEKAEVTMCRPFRFSSSPIIAVLAVYLLISVLSLVFVRRLEDGTTTTLIGFLRDSGVEIEAGRDLVGIMKDMRDIRDQLDRAKEQERLLTETRARTQLAEQVAHDIRSPLAALDAVSDLISDLPEEQRLVIRSSIERIRDIANDLLSRHGRRNAATDPSPDTPAENCLLSSLIGSVVTEKRLQFRSRLGVAIDTHIDSASYGIFARIQPVEFQRLLSNLINNAVEALPKNGTVSLSLSADGPSIFLKVKDTGAGISPEILSKLGRRGETHGKDGGSGLGLYHAKSRAESWGGSLELASEVGRGTTATLQLPKADPPIWFVSRLELSDGQSIVVLDDDTSIHQVWQGRFDSLKLKEHNIELLHFSVPKELLNWVKENGSRARDAIFLVDYKLLGHKETGLSLIGELGLGERSILVTSRFEERSVREDCARLNVRMIPKGLAGFVPVSIAEEFDAILLDDDPLVRMTWQITAKEAGKKLKTYAGAEEFLIGLKSLPKNTKLYIDSALTNGVKGEDIARQAHEQGFTEIRLATGYDPGSFPSLPHVREVVGKTSPWSSTH